MLACNDKNPKRRNVIDRSSRVVVLGGYGTFGGRLVQLLCDEPRLELVVAGRSAKKADAFCATLPAGGARVSGAVLDRDDPKLAEALKRLAPNIVVDATGPFQAYGERAYRVIEAALAADADYLDLADGSAFVREVVRFDVAAKTAGRFVLSGVSTFPVLDAAVVRYLARDLARVRSIVAGVAPLPRASVGRSVIEAIAGYAGRAVPLRRGGEAGSGYALTETRRFTIAPPGCMPLDPLTFSLVDVPDLTLLADLWPEIESVWVGAAPVPAIWHACLRGLARLVRRGVLGSLTPLAPLMRRTMMSLAWGERRGGMFVAIEGETVDGERVARSWHLIAEGDDGPSIPSMAAELIVRRALGGNGPRPGARPALRELELRDYMPAFARRAIFCGERGDEQRSADVPLYRRVLGAAWHVLPEPIRIMHGSTATRSAGGRARVVGAANWAGRLAARALGFPTDADAVFVRVTFERANGVETWRREFGAQRLTSVQYAGKGRYEGLLCERFGAFVIGLALVVEQERLKLVVRRWSVLGIPLPRVLAPRGDAFELEERGRFRFYVDIGLPLIGRVVTYMGYLDPP